MVHDDQSQFLHLANWLRLYQSRICQIGLSYKCRSNWHIGHHPNRLIPYYPSTIQEPLHIKEFCECLSVQNIIMPDNDDYAIPTFLSILINISSFPVWELMGCSGKNNNPIWDSTYSRPQLYVFLVSVILVIYSLRPIQFYMFTIWQYFSALIKYSSTTYF